MITIGISTGPVLFDGWDFSSVAYKLGKKLSSFPHYKVLCSGYPSGIQEVFCKAYISSSSNLTLVTEDSRSEQSSAHVVQNISERRNYIFEHSDYFIALPGGIATYEEIFAFIRYCQKNQVIKTLILVDVRDKFLDFFSLLENHLLVLENGNLRIARTTNLDDLNCILNNQYFRRQYYVNTHSGFSYWQISDAP